MSKSHTCGVFPLFTVELDRSYLSALEIEQLNKRQYTKEHTCIYPLGTSSVYICSLSTLCK